MTDHTDAAQDREDRLLDRLRQWSERHRPIRLASSLGAEDMVLTDLIARHRLPIEVFTLDTGRLPEETLDLLEQCRSRYRLDIAVFVPQAEPVQRWVRENGINGFRRSVDARRACCQLRKVEPLGRALRGARAWMTGLRRDQSAERATVAEVEDDAVLGLVKINPLVDWSAGDVAAYLARHEVPVNALHARGYPSIGCAPCTRAITVGEDPRAGRWWWEQGATLECGLHR